MSIEITSTQLLPKPFQGDRVRTIGASVTSGAVEIQMLVGANWVTLPEGAVVDGEVKSFYHSQDNDMRLLITGVATVSLA
jgi:hypothetical protein